MNQSPKARFLREENLARQFLDQVDSEAFQRASELAMLALQEELTVTLLDAAQTYGFQRMVGAQRFLEILKALPEPVKLPTPKPNYNLRHELQ